MKDLLLNKAIDNSNKMKHDRLMVESVTVQRTALFFVIVITGVV